jgi:trans-aconitate 2-methyltransferase
VGHFVDDVIERYQEQIGEPALFRFSQMRAALTIADR